MRELTGHKVNPANDQIEVTVRDAPGDGGACHDYQIKLPDGSGVRLGFQNGPIGVVGVNGITQEALIAILVDRLEGFQSGQFANDYNQRALDHLKSAQAELLARTTERMSRGVEGTHQQ